MQRQLWQLPAGLLEGTDVWLEMKVDVAVVPSLQPNLNVVSERCFSLGSISLFQINLDLISSVSGSVKLHTFTIDQVLH